MGEAFWTNERIDTTIRLYREGHSNTAIANMIGASSRNVIAGKLHRLGITKPMTEAARKITREVRRPKPAQFPLTAAFTFGNLYGPTVPKEPSQINIADADHQGGLRITDPGFRGCRWPIAGDGADTRFCCTATADGSNYCSRHHKRAHTTKIQLTPKEIESTERLFRRAS